MVISRKDNRRRQANSIITENNNNIIINKGPQNELDIKLIFYRNSNQKNQQSWKEHLFKIIHSHPTYANKHQDLRSGRHNFY